MLSKIAKVLFPVSLFIFAFLIALNRFWMWNILSPPYAGFISLILVMVNALYLVRFLGVLLSVLAPVGLLVGSWFVCRGIFDGGLMKSGALLLGGSGELIFGPMIIVISIALYILAYRGSDQPEIKSK